MNIKGHEWARSNASFPSLCARTVWIGVHLCPFVVDRISSARKDGGFWW